MNDIVLIESFSLRDERLKLIDDNRAVELIAKVKALVLAAWRGTTIATTEQVASYYEVPIETIASIAKNNRDELAQDGYTVLRGDDLNFAKFNLDFTNKAKIRQLAIWTPRSIIRVGMLLRYSEVAQRLRTFVLDLVEELPAVVANSAAPAKPVLPPRPEITQLTQVTELLKAAGLPQTYVERLAISNLQKYYPQVLTIYPDSTEMKSLLTTKALLNPTQLGEALNIKYSTGRGNGEYINNLLSECGYQVLIAGRWSATEKAEGLVDRKPVITNSRTAKDQLLWSSEILPILTQAIDSRRQELAASSETPDIPATPWSPDIYLNQGRNITPEQT